MMTKPRSAGDAERPRRRWPRAAGNALLVCAAVLIGLVVCELVLRHLGIAYRVFVRADPVRGVAHIPGSKTLPLADGRSRVEFNSDGLRGPEVPRRPAPGTYRIALLGDSFIQAHDVWFDETAAEVLERRLSALQGRTVEVLNFGVGGYGTTQEFLTLRHEVWKYSPHLVLLGITTGNDISDNYRPLKRYDYIPYYVYQGEELVLDTSFRSSREYRNREMWTRRWLPLVQHSRVAQLVNRVRHLSRRSERRRTNQEAPGDEVGLRDEVHLPPATEEWREAWRVTEGVLRLMRDECRKMRTPFAIVTLTRGIQVIPVRARKEEFLRQLGAKDLYYPERRLAEFGKREGIPVLNLAPTMAQQAEERQVYFHADGGNLGVGHWNAEGNRVAGELIATWLAENGIEEATTALEP